MSTIQAVVTVDKDGRVHVTGYTVHGFTASMLFNYASYMNVKHDGLERSIASTLDRIQSDRKVNQRLDDKIVYRFKDKRIGSVIRKIYRSEDKIIGETVTSWEHLRSRFNDKLKFIFKDHPFSLIIDAVVVNDNRDEHELFLNDEHLVNIRLKGGHN
jgi:hypothetical protein